MTYIIWPQEAKEFQTYLGGKAKTLAALARAGFDVPAWFLILPQAFYSSLTANQLAALALNDNQQQTNELFKAVTLNPQIKTELAAALARLCPAGEPVAVRSSAREEDSAPASFAGQFDSFLNVPPPQLASAIIRVWRSGFSDRVRTYRRKQGLDLALTPPAVLVQRMAKARKSGVAFSIDPVNGRPDVVVIGATSGLGTELVSGRLNGDTYRVDTSGHIIEVVQGGEKLPLQNGHQSQLTSGEMQAVARLARQAEQFFGQPQDIEWAIDEQGLVLLQSRPVTTRATPHQPAAVAGQDGPVQIWDNSNIAESYPGMITPLTFSFVRQAYEAVYRQFCQLMGVPGRTIDVETATFKRMLGLIQGRLYYNLISWYRVLSLLPGYKLNRGFMEQMMGVKQSLPAELQPEPAAAGNRARLLDSLYLLRTVAGLIINFVRLPRRVQSFYRRLNRALGTGAPEFGDASPGELVDYYRQLEAQLLTRWDAPLVNDFFTMIFYGTLRYVTRHWCADKSGSLQHRLLANAGGIISVEPVIRLREMSTLASTDETLIKVLCEQNLEEIRAQLSRWPEFAQQVQIYLQKYGDRCLEELKLESPTLHDEPLILFRFTGQMAHQIRQGQKKTLLATVENGGQGKNASQIVRQALAGHPVRRLIFNWVLKNTQRLVRNRENLRFERTRLFGRARLIFVELGRRFQAAGLIADSRDIFYLEVEEILGAVGGTTTTANLRGLVAVRKTEFERFRQLPPPPDRFETRGMVANQPQIVATHIGDHAADLSPNGSVRRGLGCSPGVARGPARVILNPREATFKPGEILVARHTDPGWIIFFTGAAGVLVEHGSLLSHAAIVSREMGLPAVASLAGATRWLKDGDWVELDGNTGLVRKITKPAPAPVQID